MSGHRVYYAKPSITNREIEYIHDAACKGWGKHCYEYISRFEEKFRRHLGVPYAIAASSCTGALHMGLSALGVGREDEVILGDINWIASAAPIVHLCAHPVFVDILPDTWCLDPEKVEDAITRKTKAIIAVHLYGNPCNMAALQDIAERHGIPLVEDAAEAIGTVIYGKRAGSLGTFGVFSFHGSKTVTTGEGGMFVTSDRVLYDRVLTLSNHGRSRTSAQFRPDILGYKFKMSNLQAALGCAQMERIECLIARKREIFMAYKRALSDVPEIAMNPEPPGTANGFWMPTIVFAPGLGLRSDKMLNSFASRHIDARTFFHPLSSLPMFKTNFKNRNSYEIYDRAVNLPSYHDMTDSDILEVVDVVRSVL